MNELKPEDVMKALDAFHKRVLDINTYNLAELIHENEMMAIVKAIDLINRQNKEIHKKDAEIDRLTIELQAMRGAANSLKMHLEKKEATHDP